MAALDDIEPEIASETAFSLMMLCQKNPDCRQPALETLKAHLKQASDPSFQKALNEAITEIAEMN
jgi:hypothetical protein